MIINDHAAVVTSILYDNMKLSIQPIKFFPRRLYTGNWFSYTPCIAANSMVTIVTLEVGCH